MVPNSTILQSQMKRRCYVIHWRYFFLNELLHFSQTRELYSSKDALTIAFFNAVNRNYDHKQRTLKHRNTQNGSKSINHRSQTMTLNPFTYSCFRRGSIRWLQAAKNANVSWLLNFRVSAFLKSASKIVMIPNRNKCTKTMYL